MKIQLPNQPHLFEKALTAAIETTRSCKVGISFLAHFIGLIQALRHHPITENKIKELEQEGQKRKEVFNVQAIEALEAEWIFLWRKYPQMTHRRELMYMKHLLTKSKDFTSQMPFDRACFSFSEFKVKFKSDECSQQFSEFLERNQHIRVSSDKKLYAQYIQACIELDPVYFWDRLCLLERIYQFSSKFQCQEVPIEGEWAETKYLYWNRVTNFSLQMVLRLAQKDLWARFAGDGFSNELQEFSWPVDVDCKFSRTPCEGYLNRLLLTFRSVLLNEEQNDHSSKALTPVIEKRTRPQQKTDELIKHTKAHWDKHPTANYDEVYGYYCNRCRFPKPYSSDEWEKKVRKLKLDPRPPSEKVRGFSKKER